MTETEKFVAMCKFAGERLDLIQGSGGNASVKMSDGSMLIKASGGSLSEVEEPGGYVRVENRKVLSILHDREISRLRDKGKRNARAVILAARAVTEGNGRPSIEVFLHALLDRYTLHVHPIAVNAIACRKNWKKELRALFGETALLVGYRTP